MYRGVLKESLDARQERKLGTRTAVSRYCKICEINYHKLRRISNHTDKIVRIQSTEKPSEFINVRPSRCLSDAQITAPPKYQKHRAQAVFRGLAS
jgi:hypothetical protein